MSDPELATQTSVESEFEGMEVDAPRVGIVMGSKSDMPAMEKAAKELDERGIRHEVRVMSAHRDPDTVADYAKNAKMRGLKVIIAGAGLSAALPGVVAAHTELPVIGVPLTSSMSVAGGLDALLSIAQMPPGVPVACVGVDNAKNAAVLAARILNCAERPPREPGDRAVAERVDEAPVVVARQCAVGRAERRQIGGEALVLVADGVHQRLLDLEVDERLVAGRVRDAVDLRGGLAEVAQQRQDLVGLGHESQSRSASYGESSCTTWPSPRARTSPARGRSAPAARAGRPPCGGPGARSSR